MSEKLNNRNKSLVTNSTADGNVAGLFQRKIRASGELDLPINNFNAENEQDGCPSPHQGVSRCLQRVHAQCGELNTGGGDIPDLDLTSVANLSQQPPSLTGVNRCQQRVHAQCGELNMGGGDIPDLDLTSVVNLSQQPIGMSRCRRRVHALSEEAIELDAREIETKGVRESRCLPPRHSASRKAFFFMRSFLFGFHGTWKKNCVDIDTSVAEDGAHHFYEKKRRSHKRRHAVRVGGE